MTKEDIACIIQWFAHIEQLATDRKNANGIVMEDVGHLLNTIKVIAKDSREYVERFCQPSLPSNLDEAAKEYEKRVIEETKCHHNALTYAEGYEDALLLIPDAFIAGAKWQYQKDRAEFAKLKAKEWSDGYNEGIAKGKKQMMSNAVEGWVAVDSDTYGKRRVTFFPQKPVRDVLTEYKYWAATRPRYESIKLDSNVFPNLKWEDEPKKVKLIIIKED